MKHPLPASHQTGAPTKVVIGYNPNEPAFRLSGKPGEVGFLKVFLSTEYLELDWIEQDSRLSNGLSRGSMSVACFTRPAWDAFHATVTLK